MVDPIAEGFDILIRANPDPGARLVGRRIVVTERVAVSAPGLKAPSSEEEAPLIVRSGEAASTSWTLRTANGQRVMRLRPVLSMSTLLMVHQAVLVGAGVALLPRTLVGKDIADGRLQELGVEAAASTEVWVLRTALRHPPPKVKAFTAYLKAAFSG